MTEIHDTIRRFILETHLAGESPDNLRDDTPLITSGILDSMAALGLVTFIEQTYGVELDVYDTSVERFDRITDIAACIAGRRTSAARPGAATS